MNGIKACMEYERKLRQKNGHYLTLFILGIFLLVAGILAMIPLDFKEEDMRMCGMFFILMAIAADLYHSSLFKIVEEQKNVNVFSKYRLIPVKRSVLVKGKAGLLTKFMLWCTFVFTLLNWMIRYFMKMSFFCIEAYIIPLFMLIIYLIEILRLLYYAYHTRA